MGTSWKLRSAIRERPYKPAPMRGSAKCLRGGVVGNQAQFNSFSAESSQNGGIFAGGRKFAGAYTLSGAIRRITTKNAPCVMTRRGHCTVATVADFPIGLYADKRIVGEPNSGLNPEKRLS